MYHSESDLLSLIKDAVGESLTLEYKQCAALGLDDKRKNELSKDVSAMANSAGGTIIYGIEEDGHRPIALQSGFDPSEISKEWIEHVLNSRIQRKIDGVVIRPVPLSQNSGRVAYILQIPQSDRAPHQAHDKRFYKRYNFESVPMEEYEIRDVSRRQSAPDVTLAFRLELQSQSSSRTEDIEVTTSRHRLSINVQNLSEAIVTHAIFHLFIEKHARIDGELAPFLSTGPTAAVVEGQQRELEGHQFKLFPPNSMPLFKGTEFALLNGVTYIETSRPTLLVAQVVCPGMPKRAFTHVIRQTAAGDAS